MGQAKNSVKKKQKKTEDAKKKAEKDKQKNGDLLKQNGMNEMKCNKGSPKKEVKFTNSIMGEGEALIQHPDTDLEMVTVEVVRHLCDCSPSDLLRNSGYFIGQSRNTSTKSACFALEVKWLSFVFNLKD